MGNRYITGETPRVNDIVQFIDSHEGGEAHTAQSIVDEVRNIGMGNIELTLRASEMKIQSCYCKLANRPKIGMGYGGAHGIMPQCGDIVHRKPDNQQVGSNKMSYDEEEIIRHIDSMDDHPDRATGETGELRVGLVGKFGQFLHFKGSPRPYDTCNFTLVHRPGNPTAPMVASLEPEENPESLLRSGLKEAGVPLGEIDKLTVEDMFPGSGSEGDPDAEVKTISDAEIEREIENIAASPNAEAYRKTMLAERKTQLYDVIQKIDDVRKIEQLLDMLSFKHFVSGKRSSHVNSEAIAEHKEKLATSVTPNYEQDELKLELKALSDKIKSEFELAPRGSRQRAILLEAAARIAISKIK